MEITEFVWYSMLEYFLNKMTII